MRQSLWTGSKHGPGLQTSAASAPTLEHIGKCATAKAWTVE